ncbi:MAG: site-specific DNA-methyltransferase [Anaerolineae bacterium]|nr:site-specific DNA-methyltransferase [Anaerolineae bacterium]
MTEIYFNTKFGKIIHGDSLQLMEKYIELKSVNLIMTSPPFGLVRKKDYGNVDAMDYIEWFRSFGHIFKRILRDDGSLVIDIGGSWIKGQPTRSLYHFKLLIMLCEEIGFHLAQEFYWWNPSKLPTPAEWVTVRRIRVKDAINCIWWLSPTPYPKASNRRVLQPYSDSMKDLLRNGYTAKKRPSGHDISEKFSVNNKAAIPPNLLALPNTESNSYYLRYCAAHKIKPHPARYPSILPEYFIRMLTEKGDLVIDPFAGSCITGEVAERLERRWVCVDEVEEYLEGALGRFDGENLKANGSQENVYYKIPRPGLLWDEEEEEALPEDGGRNRPKRKRKIASLPKSEYTEELQDTEQMVVQYTLLEKSDSEYNEQN